MTVFPWTKEATEKVVQDGGKLKNGEYDRGRLKVLRRLNFARLRIGSNRLLRSRMLLASRLLLRFDGVETLLEPSRLWPTPVLICVASSGLFH